MNNFINKAFEMTRSFLDAIYDMVELDWSSFEVNYTRVAVIVAAVYPIILFVAL